MSTTPHGWYPDPQDDRSMRWWDGHAWTAHVQPRPVDPAPATEAAASPEPVAPIEPPPPIEPAPPSPNMGTTATMPAAASGPPGGRSSGPALAIVVGVVVLVFGVGIALVAAGLGAGDTAGAQAEATADPEAGDDTPPSAEEPAEAPAPPSLEEGADESAVPAPGSHEAELAAVEGQPRISGTPLAPASGGTDPASDPDVGFPVPLVEGADPAGEAVTFGGAGAPQLVLMVASWCPACHAQLPEFAEWRAQGGDEDVEVVVVVTLLEPDRPGWPADQWAIAEDIPADLLMDDRGGSVANAYGLYAVPYWVVIDEHGNLVQRQAGVIEPDRIAELAEAARTGAG